VCPAPEEAARETAFELDGGQKQKWDIVCACGFTQGGVGMGAELLGGENAHAGNDGALAQDDSVVCEDKESEEIGTENYVEVLSRTMDHFFPEWNEWLRGISDPRDPELIEYELPSVIWAGLMMFLTQREARRQIGLEMRTQGFVENLKKLSGESD